MQRRGQWPWCLGVGHGRRPTCHAECTSAAETVNFFIFQFFSIFFSRKPSVHCPLPKNLIRGLLGPTTSEELVLEELDLPSPRPHYLAPSALDKWHAYKWIMAIYMNNAMRSSGHSFITFAGDNHKDISFYFFLTNQTDFIIMLSPIYPVASLNVWILLPPWEDLWKFRHYLICPLDPPSVLILIMLVLLCMSTKISFSISGTSSNSGTLSKELWTEDNDEMGPLAL